jgi:hypothetical protein
LTEAQGDDALTAMIRITGCVAWAMAGIVFHSSGSFGETVVGNIGNQSVPGSPGAATLSRATGDASGFGWSFGVAFQAGADMQLNAIKLDVWDVGLESRDPHIQLYESSVPITLTDLFTTHIDIHNPTGSSLTYLGELNHLGTPGSPGMEHQTTILDYVPD